MIILKRRANDLSEQKNIWIISHYSPDPRYNSGYRYYNWAKILVSKGYFVTIFCASTIHGTNINLIKDNNPFIVYETDGIKYVYIKCKHYKSNGVKRILNMIEFSKKLKKVFRQFDAPSIIICRLPHIWSGKTSVKISNYYHVPLIFDVADLWPDAFVEHLKIKKNNPFILYYLSNEHRMYKLANAIIFSMEGGKEFIKDKGWKDVKFEKVFHINMGVDLPQFDYNLMTYKKEYAQLLDKTIFKVSYCGSIRLINNVSTICEAAKILKDKGQKDIFISIHGFGDQESKLIDYCKENKLDNIAFFGKIDKNQIPFVLSNSDANLLSYHETPLYKYGGSMSKMFEAFAAGKPVISTVHMGYSLIERYGCGITCKSNTASALAEAIETIRDLSLNKKSEMGLHARKCAEDYSQPALVDKLLSVFEYVEKYH